MSLFFARKESAAEANEEGAGIYLSELPVDRISPNPDQPRRAFSEESISELAASISQVGLIQPIVVRPRGEGYELISGERRLRAVRSLGEQTIRCLVELEGTDERSALRAITENLQREDLHFFEEAECCARLLNRLSITQEELAAKLGKSQSYIANKLRLLRLSPELRRAVTEGGLSERHARVLLKLPDDELRRAAAERMVSGSLSVKESERLADKLVREAEESRLQARSRPRIIRIFRDYRLFINTVNSACEQLRESGLCVSVEQHDFENGVDITIKVSQ